MDKCGRCGRRDGGQNIICLKEEAVFALLHRSYRVHFRGLTLLLSKSTSTVVTAVQLVRQQLCKYSKSHFECHPPKWRYKRVLLYKLLFSNGTMRETGTIRGMARQQTSIVAAIQALLLNVSSGSVRAEGPAYCTRSQCTHWLRTLNFRVPKSLSPRLTDCTQSLDVLADPRWVLVTEALGAAVPVNVAQEWELWVVAEIV